MAEEFILLLSLGLRPCRGAWVESSALVAPWSPSHGGSPPMRCGRLSQTCVT